jgi:hypothetical protein
MPLTLLLTLILTCFYLAFASDLYESSTAESTTVEERRLQRHEERTLRNQASAPVDFDRKYSFANPSTATLSALADQF